MGELGPTLDDGVRDFLASQHVFFVATAPLAAGGHVNLSPKGLDTFRVLDPATVAYLDLSGSGIETLAHLRENGRITLLFCAFSGPPRLVRLSGRGRAVLPGDPEWAALRPAFADLPGARSIVVVALERVADSCGFGVPLFEYAGDRRRLVDWAKKKGEAGLRRYQAKNNRTSIDGLPGLDPPGDDP